MLRKVWGFHTPLTISTFYYNVNLTRSVYISESVKLTRGGFWRYFDLLENNFQSELLMVTIVITYERMSWNYRRVECEQGRAQDL